MTKGRGLVPNSKEDGAQPPRHASEEGHVKPTLHLLNISSSVPSTVILVDDFHTSDTYITIYSGELTLSSNGGASNCVHGFVSLLLPLSMEEEER